MKASADNRRISLILKMMRDQTLIPKPDFQRRSVWTNPDKIAFIETILLGYPFPEIYIAANSVDTVSGDATEVLVDGQQRISTIEAYFKGEKPFKTKALRAIPRYKDLEEEDKRQFLNYEVAVRSLGLLDDTTIREIFRRMNRTSYNLNDMERYNAVYLGKFKKFAERIAGSQFFSTHYLFSSNDVRRMKDISYVASLAVTIMSTYFNRDDDVEEYLSNYNEDFDEESTIASRFSAAFNYIESLNFPPNSRAWRKVDFYTLFAETDRQLFKKKRRPDPSEAAAALTSLFEAVDSFNEAKEPSPAVTRYVQASLRNTNDRGQRIERGAVLQDIFDGVSAEEFVVPPLPPESPYLASTLDEEADDANSADDPLASVLG